MFRDAVTAPQGLTRGSAVTARQSLTHGAKQPHTTKASMPLLLACLQMPDQERTAHPIADLGGEQMRTLVEAAGYSPEAVGGPEGGQLLLHDREAVQGDGLHSCLQAGNRERPVRVRLLDVLVPPLSGIPAGVGHRLCDVREACLACALAARMLQYTGS